MPGRRPPYAPRRAEFVWWSSGEVSRPVFGIDADGTLGEYHEHFFDFAEQYLGIKISRPYDGELSMAAHIGVSKSVYRDVKLHYRLSGLKRGMPVLPGAVELTSTLRARGAEVIICTTRPFLKVDGIEQDTREWLRRNGIQHDGVIHGEKKYHELKRRAGEGCIVGVLDDLPEMVEQAQSLSLPALLLRRPHNSSSSISEYVLNLSSANAKLVNMLYEWEKGVWRRKRSVAVQQNLW